MVERREANHLNGWRKYKWVIRDRSINRYRIHFSLTKWSFWSVDQFPVYVIYTNKYGIMVWLNYNSFFALILGECKSLCHIQMPISCCNWLQDRLPSRAFQFYLVCCSISIYEDTQIFWLSMERSFDVYILIRFLILFSNFKWQDNFLLLSK